jgi:hypothetical protein
MLVFQQLFTFLKRAVTWLSARLIEKLESYKIEQPILDTFAGKQLS